MQIMTSKGSIFVVAACLLLVGCVSTKYEWGDRAFKKQNYDLAARNWNYSAKKGNASAQNGLGVLWEFGLGSTRQNLNEAANWYWLAAKQGHILAMTNLARVQMQLGHESAALSWLELAARWNDGKAISTLKHLGRTVPEPDLWNNFIEMQRFLAERKRLEYQRQQALYNGAIQSFLLGFGCGITGGPCPLPMAPAARATPYVPSVQVERQLPMQPSLSVSPGCVSDVQCGVSEKCIKPTTSPRGSCMKVEHGPGIKSYDLKDDSSVFRCADDLSCPIGYHCDRVSTVCARR